MLGQNVAGECRARDLLAAGIAVLISLATAMLTGLAMAPYVGKETGEPSLLREQLDGLDLRIRDWKGEPALRQRFGLELVGGLVAAMYLPIFQMGKVVS